MTSAAAAAAPEVATATSVAAALAQLGSCESFFAWLHVEVMSYCLRSPALPHQRLCSFSPASWHRSWWALPNAARPRGQRALQP
eukprot:scaffold17610_cov27-Tisochrysis_lutea.AAC.1